MSGKDTPPSDFTCHAADVTISHKLDTHNMSQLVLEGPPERCELVLSYLGKAFVDCAKHMPFKFDRSEDGRSGIYYGFRTGNAHLERPVMKYLAERFSKNCEKYGFELALKISLSLEAEKDEVLSNPPQDARVVDSIFAEHLVEAGAQAEKIVEAARLMRVSLQAFPLPVQEPDSLKNLFIDRVRKVVETLGLEIGEPGIFSHYLMEQFAPMWCVPARKSRAEISAKFDAGGDWEQPELGPQDSYMFLGDYHVDATYTSFSKDGTKIEIDIKSGYDPKKLEQNLLEHFNRVIDRFGLENKPDIQLRSDTGEGHGVTIRILDDEDTPLYCTLKEITRQTLDNLQRIRDDRFFYYYLSGEGVQETSMGNVFLTREPKLELRYKELQDLIGGVFFDAGVPHELIQKAACLTRLLTPAFRDIEEIERNYEKSDMFSFVKLAFNALGFGNSVQEERRVVERAERMLYERFLEKATQQEKQERGRNRSG